MEDTLETFKLNCIEAIVNIDPENHFALCLVGIPAHNQTLVYTGFSREVDKEFGYKTEAAVKDRLVEFMQTQPELRNLLITAVNTYRSMPNANGVPGQNRKESK